MNSERILEIEAYANRSSGAIDAVSDRDVFDTKKTKVVLRKLIEIILELAKEVRRQREEIGQLNFKIALKDKNEEET